MKTIKRFYAKISPTQTLIVSIMWLFGGSYIAGTMYSVGDNIFAYIVWGLIISITVTNIVLASIFTDKP
jgi:hypothetical protein